MTPPSRTDSSKSSKFDVRHLQVDGDGDANGDAVSTDGEELKVLQIC